MKDHHDKGIYVVNRRTRSFDDSANQLADMMMSFVRMNRRDRISQRNRVESSSGHFDWQNLTSYYDKAYMLVLERSKF
ncbi:MAG TPA: glycogen synthase, partial [Cytophagaceae bacterium]